MISVNITAFLQMAISTNYLHLRTRRQTNKKDNREMKIPYIVQLLGSIHLFFFEHNSIKCDYRKLGLSMH